MKQLKRLISLVLAASLSLALVSCGGNSAGNGSGSAGGSSSKSGDLTPTQQIIQEAQGMTMEELDPSTRREMETIATLQNASTQDIGWILEDLSYYKSRTGERIYSDLYNQMNAFSLRDKLDLVHGNILNAITARSIDESRLYASTLRHWAKLIDDYKKSRRGGGGGGGGGGGSQSSISDAEFEFMLKLIRMIQQEQDIRMRTRAAEQEHRKKFTPPAP